MSDDCPRRKFFYCYHNIEKKNNLIKHQILFCILGAPIIFSCQRKNDYRDSKIKHKRRFKVSSQIDTIEISLAKLFLLFSISFHLRLYKTILIFLKLSKYFQNSSTAYI